MPKFKFNRDYYKPASYALIAKDERFGFEVWGSIEPGKIVAAAFGGKRSKPDWHYRFSSMERLNKKIEETLRGFMQYETRKAERKAESTAPHDVKVGDIFRASWGYDQTNVDYFQCTKVIGAMIEIREIARQSEERDYMQGDCVPTPNNFIGEPMRKRVCTHKGGEPSVRIYSFASAYRIKPLADVAGVKVYGASSWSAYA